MEQKNSYSQSEGKERNLALSQGEEERNLALSQGEEDRNLALSQGEEDRNLALSQGEEERTLTLSQDEKDRTLALPQGEEKRNLALSQGEKERSLALTQGEEERTLTLSQDEKRTLTLTPIEEEKVRTLTLDGSSLTLSDLWSLLADEEEVSVSLSATSLEKVSSARAALEGIVAEGGTVYGATTQVSLRKGERHPEDADGFSRDVTAGFSTRLVMLTAVQEQRTEEVLVGLLDDLLSKLL